MYVKVVNGAVSAYPYGFGALRNDYPQTSFPADPPNELLAEYGVYPVTPVDRPASTLTQDAVEQTPELVNGAWTQVWVMVNVNAEEAARRQRDAADQQDQDSVKADAFVQNFIAMTPAQVETYVTNKTANLTQTRALLTKMALMMLALARRAYR